MSRIGGVAASRPTPAALATQLKGLLRQDTTCITVDLPAELQTKLDAAAALSGHSASELVADALESYLDELAGIRQTLDSRYDEMKSGRVRPLDGEAFFEELRRREEEPIRRSA